MAQDKWEIYKDKKEKWRWRRSSANGNIVGASTESYSSRTSCVKNAAHYGYEGTFNPDGKWEFYEDKKKEWRWRHTARNGKIIGASSEGYNKKSDCVASAARHGCKEKA